MLVDPARRTDFFISYTQADRAWAEWIAWTLEQAGFKTRVQAWDFRPGNNFVLAMQQATEKAKTTVALLSADYLASEFGSAEWASAFARDPTGVNRKLVMVRVGDVSLEGLLAAIVNIDLVGLGEAAARERLLAGLASGRAKPAVAPLFPGRPRFPGGPLLPKIPAAVAQPFDLPLDKIPDVSSLPFGSRIPLSANPLFVGRQEELRELSRTLRPGETVATQVDIAAITGLGGVGKTQLASEFVHRYGHLFPGGAFWISFAEEAAIPAEIAACGPGLGLHTGYDTLALDQQVRLVQDAWQSPLSRLLVFDNCEDPKLLDRWRPRFGGARVLVTSRRSRWSATFGVNVVPLGVLERNLSIEFLRRFRPEIPAGEPALEGIASELGDLPLALHLAGSFLERYRDAPFGQPIPYLERLRQSNLLSHPSLQGKGGAFLPTGHESHVARTFAMSYERLDASNPVDVWARKLLTRATHFACGEPIPRSLLLSTLQVDLADEKTALQGEDALDRLLGLGLLESGQERLLLHRLVAAFAKEVEGEPEARVAVEEVLLKEAGRLNDAGYPVPLLDWQVHLRHVVEATGDFEDAVAAGLRGELGYHLYLAGDLQGAEPYLAKALEIREKILGSEHPDTAASLNDLGQLHCDLGDYAGAWSCHEQALAIREKILGPEHPSTATSLNNLGFTLSEQGLYEQAWPYHERALAIREKVLGTDHPETAMSLNNLGHILAARGDTERAWQYHERALAIREKVLGLEHPETAMSLNNLGFVLAEKGDYAGAWSYHERALAIREEVLGPDHPETAISLNNLGYVLAEKGDYAGAWPYHERALAIREKILGPEHPETAMSLNNLGFILAEKGDYAGACPYHERALAIRERVLGPEHPETAMSLNNLGHILAEQGDTERAWQYQERALAIREKVLAPEHPGIAMSLNNLGFILNDKGDYAGARPYHERALGIREKVFGPDHRDTATSLNNLGFSLVGQGCYEAALPYHRRALAIRERFFGAGHPETATSLSNLGSVLLGLGDFKSSRRYHAQALAIRKRVFGLNHSETARSLNRLGLLHDKQGDLKKARRSYERALSILERQLGAEHLEVAVSLHGLGDVLHVQGFHGKACECYERAWAIREKHLGSGDPQTTASRERLERCKRETTGGGH